MIYKPGIKRMVTAAMLLALAEVLPFLTGQVPRIGNLLCPMHFPVLLCGFLCGPYYALAVGFLAPILRALIFSMPPFFPNAISMAFEMATYGILAGFLYKLFPHKRRYLYLTLAISMIAGRLVWGVASAFFCCFSENVFTLKIFLVQGFTNAIPGIILQIIVIPVLVMIARRFDFVNVSASK